PALSRRARGPAPRRPRSLEPRAQDDGRAAPRSAGRDRSRGRPGARRAGTSRRMVVVEPPLVRAPEPAGRAGRSVHLASVRGCRRLLVRGAGDDAGDVRRPAAEGRGDVPPRDVRPRGHGPRRSGMTTDDREGTDGSRWPSAAELDALVAGFVAATLPKRSWTHL